MQTTDAAPGSARGAPQRPTGITMTAWLWIVTGVFMAISGVLGGLAYSAMSHMAATPGTSANMPPDLQPVFAMMTGVFRYFGVIVAIQIAVAVMAIWAGIALLKLRAWARTTIEILSWLSLLYCVGFGAFWLFMWSSMSGQMPAGGAPIDAETFQTLGAVIGVVVIAVFAIPLWIMIRYLRGAEVRDAIDGAQARR